MKYEVSEQCLRTKILLDTPMLAAVTVIKQTLPDGPNFFNHRTYTEWTRQPKCGERRLLKQIDPSEHASVRFIRHNLKLKQKLTVGAELLSRSLLLMLQVARDQGVTRSARSQPEEYSSGAEGELGRLHRAMDQVSGEFSSSNLPDDMWTFISNWADLLCGLTHSKRGATDPSPESLVETFALSKETCNRQPVASTQEVRRLAAFLAPEQFAQRGLIDVIDHLAGITDSIAHHPNEWLPAAFPPDPNASDDSFCAT
jgi:hypothetical protein